MTREELERAIADMMEGAYSTDEVALEAARGAVRLVVEACITELVEKAGQPFAAAVLHRTFLPTTKEPTDG